MESNDKAAVNTNNEDFIKTHTKLVHKIASNVMYKVPNVVQYEDLVQAGMIGLIEAARKFQDDKGASFETYAGIRIKGAIIDELRRSDWTPRSVHKNMRDLSHAVSVIETRTGRDARDMEIASQLGKTLDEYHKILKDISTVKVIGIEDISKTIEYHTSNDLFDSWKSCPVENAQREESRDKLAECILQLPQRERIILSLYYEEELNLKEVGEVLGVSESRISQLHGKAMSRLQMMMQKKSPS